MADLVRQQLEGVPRTMRSRYRDMGDGTHALVVSTDMHGTVTVAEPVTVDGTVNVGTVAGTVTTTGYVGLLNETAIPYGVKQIDGKPRVSSMPYTYDIAEGHVTNHIPWTKLSYTPAMNSTENDLWSAGGVINFPATEVAMEVYANSNTDTGTSIKSGISTGGTATSIIDATTDFSAPTAAAIGDCVILDKSGASPEYGWITAIPSTTELTIGGGFSRGGAGGPARDYYVLDYGSTTGAQAVEITYLDADFVEHREIVILNGQATRDLVNTDTYRINAFRMIAAGSGAKPAGYLSLRLVALPNTIYSYITAGFTRARNSAYTVPAGYTLFVTEFTVSFGYAAAQTYYARVYTRATQNDGFRTPGIFYPFTEIVLANSSQLVRLDMPTRLEAGVDIKVSGVTVTTTGTASVALRGWLEW